MRSLTRPLALLLLLAGVAHADGFPHDESPYQLSAPVDAPLITGGAILWILPLLLVSPTAQGPTCGSMATPCDINGLNALDRWAVGNHDSSMRIVADVAYAIPMIGFFTLDMLDVGLADRAWLIDFAVLAESQFLDGVLDELVRRGFRRPRPFLFEPDAYPSERNKAESTFSFYSGHTASMFNFAAGISYTYTLRHPGSRWNWAVWTTLLALSSIEPVARVLSGDHFPTDVMVGALIGTGVGILIPALHRRAPQISIGPSVEGGRTSVMLTGRF